VGFRDDYLKVVHKNRDGISSREKIFWQTLITVVALAVLLWHPTSAGKIRELWVPFIKHPVLVFSGILGLPALFIFIYLWLVGFSNAINLTDGLDGLAIGCTISVALVYGIMAYAAGNILISEYLLISYVPGTGELTVLCGALVGAGVAFLWYNSHPAEVFMGDTGSLALGGLIGIIAFMVQQPLTLIIVGGVFVWEAVSVIIQVGYFKYTKRRSPTGQGSRYFLMAPIHHHFQKKGWPETKVVLRFWVLSLIFALIGLATLKIR
jgi:phospho-N-acetylmuramoyl-pentapeptide-transferase